MTTLSPEWQDYFDRLYGQPYDGPEPEVLAATESEARDLQRRADGRTADLFGVR